MKIQYENTVIYQPCRFNFMAGADVRNPCGEFAKRQGIIHFACPLIPKVELSGIGSLDNALFYSSVTKIRTIRAFNYNIKDIPETNQLPSPPLLIAKGLCMVQSE